MNELSCNTVIKSMCIGRNLELCGGMSSFVYVVELLVATMELDIMGKFCYFCY